MQEEEELHGEKMLTEFNVKRRTKAFGGRQLPEKSGRAEHSSNVSEAVKEILS